MAISLQCFAVCDNCEEHTEESRPCIDDIIDYAERGGWVQREEGLFCDYCHDIIFGDGDE